MTERDGNKLKNLQKKKKKFKRTNRANDADFERDKVICIQAMKQ